MVRGSKHRAAKLNEDDVRDIRRLHRVGGTTIVEIAQRFGVVSGTIDHILRGRTWSHVI
jgi:hypothetical protein